MKRVLLIVLCMMSWVGASAQSSNNFTIKGRVVLVDDVANGAVGVVVKLTPKTDNEVPRAVSTDINGEFSIKSNGDVVELTFSCAGYKDKVIEVAAQEGQSTVTIDEVMLNTDAHLVESVVVEGQASMAMVKGDTLQYNAAAFKTHPDATAEDLLKKMPGVTTDDDGNLESAGEKISKVYVNGKEFFMDDPSMALKSLPVDAVESVQLYDDQSDEAKFSGFDDGERLKTINIVTKRGVMNSTSGRFSAGYANQGGYAAGAQVNGFGDVHNFTVIASSNDVNRRDYTPRSLTSGSGGGRRSSGSSGADLAGFSTSSQSSIAERYMIGANYSGQYENSKLSATYFYSGSNADMWSGVNQSYLTQVRDYNQVDTTVGYSNFHMLRTRYEWTPNDANRFNFNTSLSYSNNFGDKVSLAETFIDNLASNASASKYRTNLEQFSGNADLWWQTRLSETGRTLSVGAMFAGNRSFGDRNQFSNYTAFDPMGVPTLDTIDLLAFVQSTGYTMTGSATYAEPLGTKSRLQANYSLSYNRTFGNNEGYDMDNLLQQYSLMDTSTTNYIARNYTTHMAGLGYNFVEAKKFTLAANVVYQNSSLYSNQIAPLYDYVPLIDNYSFEAVLPSVSLNYTPVQGQNLRLDYTTNSIVPTVGQLQTVMNTTNPLQVSSGNPHLEQGYSHRLTLRYSLANPQKNINFNVYAMGTTTSNFITTHRRILENEEVINGVNVVKNAQYSAPVNLQGYYNASLFTTFSFGINPIKSNMSISAYYRYAHTPSIENNVEYFSDANNFGTRLSLTSNISEDVDFTLSYRPSLNLTGGINERFDRYFSHDISANANIYFFKYFFINGDLSWRNTFGTQELYTQHYTVLNAHVGAKLFKDRSAEIRFSVYDALDQSQSIRQSVNDTFTQISASSVLGRYFMVSLAFKFDTRKSGRSSEGESDRGGYGDGAGGGGGRGGRGGF